MANYSDEAFEEYTFWVVKIYFPPDLQLSVRGWHEMQRTAPVDASDSTESTKGIPTIL